MKLYQLSKTGGGSCCSCKFGVVKPHAPLKDKKVMGCSPMRMVNGSGMISKITPSKMNEPIIPNTESLQRKLVNLSNIKVGGKRNRYVHL